MGNTSAFVPSFDRPENIGTSSRLESQSPSQQLRKPPMRVAEVAPHLEAGLPRGVRQEEAKSWQEEGQTWAATV